eukprot:UN18791
MMAEHHYMLHQLAGLWNRVRMLVWNGAHVNAIDRFGFSPLFEAVQRGHKEVAKYLQTQGAKLGLNEENCKLLCWGAFQNDISSIRRLVETELTSQFVIMTT